MKAEHIARRVQKKREQDKEAERVAEDALAKRQLDVILFLHPNLKVHPFKIHHGSIWIEYSDCSWIRVEGTVIPVYYCYGSHNKDAQFLSADNAIEYAWRLKNE